MSWRAGSATSPVDEGWGAGDAPADVGGGPAAIAVPELAERLKAAPSRIDDRFIRDWDPYSEDSFAVVITSPPRRRPAGLGVAGRSGGAYGHPAGRHRR
jgi:hypothetical protein